MSQSNTSVLIVGPSWVGDMVMAQSLFIALKNQYATMDIDVLAPAWSLPLLKRMPQIRQAIALDVGHGQLGLLKRWQLGKSLRAKSYDQAIVLPRSLKSALVPFIAGIPKRVGYKGEYRYGLLNDIRRFDQTQLDQTVKRFVALGQSDDADYRNLECPKPKLDISQPRQIELINSLGLSRTKKVVGIMPGAEYGPAKQWPIEYYAELLRRLAQINIDAWIFGSQKEHALAESIVGLSGGQGANLCGRTELTDAVDLIAASDVVVSNDSGLMHVAAAVQTPLVAIYGSSSPFFTPPLSDSAEIMYQALECSPCFKRQCPLGHLNCLKQVSVEAVLDKILQLISS